MRTSHRENSQRPARERRNAWRWALLAPVLLFCGYLVTGSTTASAARITSCDINGDGIDDLPVGSTGETFRNQDDEFIAGGRIDLMVGSTTRAMDEPSEGWAWLVNNGDSRFGATLLCNDLNRDGHVDLIIGSRFADIDVGRANPVRNAGRVEILYGSEAGLQVNGEIIHQATPGISGRPQVGDVFGTEIAVGFFDSDDWPDLAISAPGEDIRGVTNAGQVHIVYGGPDGFASGARDDSVIHQNSAGIKDRTEENDYFGRALISADFDGDTYADLAIGIPAEDVNGHFDAGAVQVIYGGPQGLTRRDQFLHQDLKHIPGSADDGDYFGEPLIEVDVILNAGNRRFDLVVSAPREDVGGVADAGAVYLLAGTPNGLRGDNGGQILHRNRPGIRERPQPGDEFGTSLAAGFYDDDGFVDFAIGVPGDDSRNRSNTGAVHIVYGHSNGGFSQRDREIHQGTPGVPGLRQRSDRFGTYLAGGDFDGDGLTDLAVGVPLEDVRGRRDAGVVTMLWGRGTGMNGTDARQYDQDSFRASHITASGNDIGGVERDDKYGSLQSPIYCCGGLGAVTGPPTVVSSSAILVEFGEPGSG